MSLGGRTFRAFRPSQFGRIDGEVEEEAQQVRQSKIGVYSQRAEAGLPLFESTSTADSLVSGRNIAI